MDIRRAREDAGLSLSRVADAAGVSKSHLHAIESEASEPSLKTLARVGGALGLDLSVRYYPGTGPLLRDHFQAAIIEELLCIRQARWQPMPEVWVTRPVRGVIDLVLDAAPASNVPSEPLIATEAQSELRRPEQQIRWAHAKAEALGEARGQPVSQLLLLRNTHATRAVVAEHAKIVRAAYPAASAAAYAALTTARPWPGSALLWADVAGGRATIRPAPPRGIPVGR